MSKHIIDINHVEREKLKTFKIYEESKIKNLIDDSSFTIFIDEE